MGDAVSGGDDGDSKGLVRVLLGYARDRLTG